MNDALLIAGPPGSGKTERALTHYRDAVDRGGADAALLLLPNAAAVADAKRRLVRAGAPGMLQPHIMQFYALVGEVLQAGGEPETEVSEGTKHFLLSRIAAEMHRAGELQHFARVADRPGFAAALATFIAELKQATILPEDFEKAIRRIRTSPRDKDLVRIYAEYQKRLKDAKLYDADGKLWRVRDLIAEGVLGSLGHVRTVVVDGFVNFTAAQFGIIRSLAARSSPFVITLTADDTPHRGHLFRTANETLQQVQKHLGPTLVREDLPPRSAGVIEFDRLADKIFSGHFAHDFSGAPGSSAVQLVESVGRAGEIEDLAREVKIRLVEGGAEPSEVAILTHSSSRDALIGEVFARMEIPVHFAAPRPLEAFPLVRILFCLIRLLEGDESRPVVMALLRSVRVLRQGDADLWSDRVDQLCRMANVIEGRRKIIVQLRALAHQYVNKEEAETATPSVARDAERAANELDDLFRLLDTIPTRATFGAFCAQMGNLLEQCGFFQPVPPGESAPDRLRRAEAANAIRRVLCEIATLDRLKTPGSGEVSRSTFLEQLRRAVANTQVRRSPPACKAVCVIPFVEARGRFFEHVFIPGMLEAEVSAAPRSCPFYSDRERRRLSAGGMAALKERSPQRSDSQFAFFLAVTRARSSLLLSRASVDVQGKPQTASHYLEEIRRLLTGPAGCSLETSHAEPGAVFPSYARAGCAADLGGRMSAGLWRGDGSAARLLNGGLLASLWDRAGIAARAAVAARRDAVLPFDAWDGRLEAPPIRAILTADLAAGPVSAAGLDQYMDCPYRYFANRVLKLAEFPEPEPEADPARLGNIVHDIAFDLFRLLRERPGGNTTFDESELPAVLALLDTASDDRFGRELAAGAVHKGALWAVQRRLIVEILKRLTRAQAADPEAQEAPIPTHFEISFGMGRLEDSADPASVPEPLEVGKGEDKVLIRGRIDRIDLVRQGHGFRVLDYKTGNPPATTAVRDGKSLQLPIYAMAAEQLIFHDRADMEIDSADFVPLKEETAKVRQRVVPRAGDRAKPAIASDAWEQTRQKALERIGEIATSIRDGAFSIAPRQKKTCSYCEFRPICLYSKTRHEAKLACTPSNRP